MGLRELKKEQTRQLIADTAWRLFAERGFDQVSVAEVAREARVAEATVYNYFRTKEDLFYWRLEVFGTRFARAEAGDARALDQLRTVNQLIAASPALLAREQEALNQATSVLVGVLAADTCADPGDLRPQVAAHALIGVHRTLLDYVRSRVQVGDNPAGLAAEIREVTAGAFEFLEQGLHNYAAEPAPAADEVG